MKKLAILLVVIALFLVTAVPAMASEPFRRIVIPATGLSVAVQPLRLGEDPNHETAWVYDVWPNALFMHRGWTGAELDKLRPGDAILLYDDWCAEGEPLRLWVTRVQDDIAAKDEERLVLDRAGGNLFAFITCHPADDPTAPLRLVVWATSARPRWPRGLRR